MALLEGDPFFDESVRVRCVQMRVSERGDRVVALLISDDEDNVGAFHKEESQ
jgi:hypothetical protein